MLIFLRCEKHKSKTVLGPNAAFRFDPVLASKGRKWFTPIHFAAIWHPVSAPEGWRVPEGIHWGAARGSDNRQKLLALLFCAKQYIDFNLEQVFNLKEYYSWYISKEKCYIAYVGQYIIQMYSSYRVLLFEHNLLNVCRVFLQQNSM